MRYMEPSWFGKGMTAYYENWTYYLNAADAEKLFAQVGAELKLQAEMTEAKDKTTVTYQEAEKLVNCRVKEGAVYYKIRDLAELTGAEMSWNGEKKEIIVQHEDKVASITFLPAGQETETFSAKIMSFLLR